MSSWWQSIYHYNISLSLITFEILMCLLSTHETAPASSVVPVYMTSLCPSFYFNLFLSLNLEYVSYSQPLVESVFKIQGDHLCLWLDYLMCLHVIEYCCYSRFPSAILRLVFRSCICFAFLFLFRHFLCIVYIFSGDILIFFYHLLSVVLFLAQHSFSSPTSLMLLLANALHMHHTCMYYRSKSTLYAYYCLQSF